MSQAAGAVFNLNVPARESRIVNIGKWEVEVKAQKNAVVARDGSATSYDEAFSDALLAAQKGLDLLSIAGGNDLVINSFDSDHMVWWHDTELVVRHTALAELGIDVPPVTVEVRDGSGAVVASPAVPKPTWHESFRYFRLSQTTDDLFDAYRNAYLALESILSHIAPQVLKATGKPVEPEGVWFRRALEEAAKRMPLSAVVPNGTADPVSYLMDELYGVRCEMSHAKGGRPILLPQDEAEREKVTNSLLRLVSLYLRLAEDELNARRPGGAISAFMFSSMNGPALDGLKVAASDQTNVGARTGTVVPLSGEIIELIPTGPADTSVSFVATKIWSRPSSDLRLPIRRIVASNEDGGLIDSNLSHPLVLVDSVRFEVMLGVRGTNTRQPRTRYSL